MPVYTVLTGRIIGFSWTIHQADCRQASPYLIDFSVPIDVLSLIILIKYTHGSSFLKKEQEVAIRQITGYISPSRHIAH